MALLVLAAGALAVGALPGAARADDSSIIKIGILDSLTGENAAVETPLKDMILMLVADTNAHGGLLGKQLVPFVVDPASNWPLFADRAHELLADDHVAVVFGGWTPVSLQAAEPLFARLNGLLIYPAPYADEDVSPNVFYTGAAPSQQAVAAIDYLRSARGGGVRRWVLEGTDYIYPHQMNDGIRAYLLARKVSPDDIIENETPFDFSDWKGEIARIKAFGGGAKKTAVVSTLMGAANDSFYAELDTQGVHSRHVPVLSLTLDEQALTQLSPSNIAGGLASGGYFEAVKSTQNAAFKAQWQAFVHDPSRVADGALEATYIGYRLWTQAVTKAGSTDVDAVRTAMVGQGMMSPSGYAVTMQPDHHLARPAMIGVVRKNGQFMILYQSPNVLPARLWSAVLAQPAAPEPATPAIRKPATHKLTATKPAQPKKSAKPKAGKTRPKPQ